MGTGVSDPGYIDLRENVWFVVGLGLSDCALAKLDEPGALEWFSCYLIPDTCYFR